MPTRAGLGVVPLDTSAWMVERAIAVRRMTSRRCSSTAGLCRVRVGSGISPVAPVLALTSAVRKKIATRGQVSARRATLHAWSTSCRRCRGRRATLRGSPLARGQDGGGAAAPARVSAVWPLGGFSGVGGRGCDDAARPRRATRTLHPAGHGPHRHHGGRAECGAGGVQAPWDDACPSRFGSQEACPLLAGSRFAGVADDGTGDPITSTATSGVSCPPFGRVLVRVSARERGLLPLMAFGRPADSPREVGNSGVRPLRRAGIAKISLVPGPRPRAASLVPVGVEGDVAADARP